jgi:hypothetical protein
MLARSQPAGPEHAGYKSWQATTAEPYTMLDAADCRPGNQPLGPHQGRYIRVFVNGPGRDAIGTAKPYPVGSVIVKEKLLKRDDATPNELGIMIKRESGWEYKFIGADGKLAEGNNVNSCATCHARAKHDSVFIAEWERK